MVSVATDGVVTVRSSALSEQFYTIDTYGQFSTDYLDEDWKEESVFHHKQFVKDLAELHAEVIGEYCEPGRTIEGVRVVDTWSPREYNFATDQAELEIDVHLEELRKYLEYGVSTEFDEFLHENFTSRDGFWSFTPNNIMDFNEVLDGVSAEYKSQEDFDKCVAILAGWYLAREGLTEQEYLDAMYDRVPELMYNNFDQFTQETWDEYDKWCETHTAEDGMRELEIDERFNEYKEKKDEV